ncbi:hypothetical protein PYW07_002852 [Mythimna separata]|uniref:Uncharacterized protein n=1 Tax=Mythimna separata TaxID=271217 RepID=A0AAD7YGM7_MYTSE|nr:hypothetical protein PYW07_002852 [Mythimna separata]
MNLEESSEGSSCNGQENGDGSNGSERPLKKARFAWQVKGKYHLKNENNDPAKISTTESTVPETAGPSGSGSNSSNSNNIDTEQDIKTISGYSLNKNFDTLNSVFNEPDKSGLKPSKRNLGSRENSISNIFTPSATLAEEILNNTRNFISQDNTECKIVKPIDAQIGNSEVPISNYMFQSDDNCDEFEFGIMSMMTPQKYTEDQCIARWQAKQMAKGPLDNTINRILDYMKQNPLEEGNATLESFDVADIINDRPGVDSIENEGILMAISAHGLQNTSNSSSSSMSLDFKEICVPSIKSPALRISFSPIHSDDECNEEIQHEFECALDKVQWPYSEKLKSEDNETIPAPTFHGTSSLSFQNLYENLHDADAASNDAAIENDNHHDFLDTAVLFAIQSKGLTTFGTDYG